MNLRIKSFVLLMVSMVMLFPVQAEAKSYVYTYDQSLAGVVDVNITCSSSSNIYIYYGKANKVINKPSLAYYGVTKVNTVLQKINTTHYYVKVSTNNGKKATITCKLKQHLDTKKSSTGGIWIPSGKGKASSLVTYGEKYYFSKNMIKKAMEYVENNEYLNFETTIAQTFLTITNNNIKKIPSLPAKLLAYFISCTKIINKINFTNITKSKINNAADSDHDGIYENGCMIYWYYTNGCVPVLSVNKWTSNTMEGYKGYSGYFEVF